MEKKFDTTEDVLEQALLMAEGGVSTDKILKKFPADERMLRGVFDTIDILKRESNKITPSSEGLQNILNAIQSESVITSPYLTLSWIKKYGIFLSAGVIATLVLVLNTGTKNRIQVAQNTDTSTISTFSTEGIDTNAPLAKMMLAPSGNIDDTVQSINTITLAESESANTEARDASLASYDSDQFNNYATDNYENNL